MFFKDPKEESYGDAENQQVDSSYILLLPSCVPPITEQRQGENFKTGASKTTQKVIKFNSPFIIYSSPMVDF